MLLSKLEAAAFLRETLHITTHQCENRLELLHIIARAFYEHFAYQNLTYLVVPEKDRRVLTREEIKEEIMSGRGGRNAFNFPLCFYIFKFLLLLLVRDDLLVIRSAYSTTPFVSVFFKVILS